MDIKNQYIALGLMATKRIIVDPDKGLILNKDKKPYSPINIDGYLQYSVSLGHSAGIFTAYGHCLVYLWIHGTFDPKLVIDHKDRNRGNNAISNLRCITQRENIIHSHKIERKAWTAQPGHNQRKLPLSTHKEIYDLWFTDGLSWMEIADKLGISRQTAARIAKAYQASLKTQAKQRSFDFFNPVK